MKRIKFIEGCLCLILSACMLGPEYQRPEFFDNVQLEKVLDLKTPSIKHLPFGPEDFHDSKLNELIQEAIENAPDIRTALVRLRASRAAKLAAISTLFPSVDATEQHTDQVLGDNMGLIPNENNYQVGISIAWEIDLFGKKRREIEAASLTEKQMILTLENVMVLVVSEISSIYVSLRTNQYLLEQTKSDLKIQQELARLTHDKYKSGLSNAIDVNQADYQVSTTQSNIPKLETQIEGYENALAVLLGKPAGSLQKELASSKDNLIKQPFKYSFQKLFKLPVEVVRYRPDVLAAEQALRIQNAHVGEAIANLFPTISLSAFLGFESIHFDNLFEDKSHAHSYRTSIAAPIFHFGGLWQNIKIEEANMEEAMITYEKKLLQATKEIKDILVGLQKMKERHKNLEKAWQKMDVAANLARNRYESGLIDYFQVLDAEERRIAAQAALISSCGDLYQNILNFYKSIGGQFTFDHINESKTEQSKNTK